MGWWSVAVDDEKKQEADKLKMESKRKRGKKPTNTEIFERGIEQLAEDMGVELEEEEKDDFMDVFK